jgi:hypothetical protein
MKKLLILLLLSVSFTAIAQKTYSIDRQLQLENVTQGIKKDSVLVRGSDKIIRYIPRSEFGGGGSQNLDQTLANGNITNKDIILDESTGKVTTISPSGMDIFHSTGGLGSIDNKRVLMSDNAGKSLSMKSDRFIHNGVNGSIDLNFDSSATQPYTQTFQAKSGTIALKSDIQGVQSVTGDIVNNANPLRPVVLSTGLIKTTGNQTKEGVLSFVNTEFAIGNKIEIENHDYYGMGTGLHINNKGGKGIIIDHSGNRGIEINIAGTSGYGLLIDNKGSGVEAVNIGNFGSSDGIVINNLSGTSARGLLIGASGTGEALVIGSGPEQTKDTVLIDNSGSGTVGNAINITSEGISVAKISKTGYITHKPAVTSDQSATLGQITTVINARTVENASNTALTTADLNNNYPTATKGFRVVPSSLTGAGKIYEKTSTGWIQYAVTVP